MCGTVIYSSCDKALSKEEAVVKNMQLLDIRRCEELVPI